MFILWEDIPSGGIFPGEERHMPQAGFFSKEE